jgi:hypothetical protein
LQSIDYIDGKKGRIFIVVVELKAMVGTGAVITATKNQGHYCSIDDEWYLLQHVTGTVRDCERYILVLGFKRMEEVPNCRRIFKFNDLAKLSYDRILFHTNKELDNG